MPKSYTRTDLIKSGYQLMYHQGYHAVSIKDITADLEIPKGSFYNHFSSKEEFGIEVLQYYREFFEDLMIKRLSDENISPLSRIREHFENLIEDFKGVYQFRLGCLAGNFGQEMADVNEVFRKEVEDSLSSFTQILSKCIAEAQSAGEIDVTGNPQDLAYFIMNAWEGTLLRMKSSKSDEPLTNFMKFIFDLFKSY